MSTIENYTPINLLFSFLFTWVLGLLLAYLVRFKLYKKPLKKRFAIPLTFLIWVIHIIISLTIKEYAGVEGKPSNVLGLVALVSFFVLTKKNDEKKESN